MGVNIMLHSLSKVWIHGVIRTKNGEPLIKPDLEQKLYDHIRRRLEQEFKCILRAINGTADHIHILFMISTLFSISELFKHIKGESSHWINESNLIDEKFAWQPGYGAFSISELMLKRTERYIKNQKEHHRLISFDEEMNAILSK